MKLESFIALRYLRSKHKNRFINLVTLFSVGGILVGVAAIIIVVSIMNGMESEIRSRILDTTAHITVFSLKKSGITDWRALVKKIEDYPDVVGASPFVQSKGAIAGPKSSDGVLIRGIDTTYEPHTSKLPEMVIEGEYSLAAPDSGLPEILLGVYLADQIGARVGDTVAIFVLRKNSLLGARKPVVKKFVVAGIFETGMYDYDAILCYIPISVAQKIFGLGEAVTGIQVKIKNFYRAPQVAKKLMDYIGFPYYTIPWTETNKNLFSWMTIEKWAMFLVLGLIIVVAAFNIVSTLMMVVMEKTQDIGILMALGAKKRSIVRIFLYQGIIVGALGTILGGVIGVAAVLIQDKYKIISLPPDVYSISSLPMQLRFEDVAAVVVLTMAISVASAIYPALRAARLNPVDAIRYG